MEATSDINHVQFLISTDETGTKKRYIFAKHGGTIGGQDIHFPLYLTGVLGDKAEYPCPKVLHPDSASPKTLKLIKAPRSAYDGYHFANIGVKVVNITSLVVGAQLELSLGDDFLTSLNRATPFNAYFVAVQKTQGMVTMEPVYKMQTFGYSMLALLTRCINNDVNPTLIVTQAATTPGEPAPDPDPDPENILTNVVEIEASDYQIHLTVSDSQKVSCTLALMWF